MVDDLALKEWFCREVLPLERAFRHLSAELRVAAEVVDLRQDIYERVPGARHACPPQAGQFVYTVARNHLTTAPNVRESFRSTSVSIWTRSLETTYWIPSVSSWLARSYGAFNSAWKNCRRGGREVVLLRKIRGLSTRETAG